MSTGITPLRVAGAVGFTFGVVGLGAVMATAGSAVLAANVLTKVLGLFAVGALMGMARGSLQQAGFIFFHD
ncbi:MAG: hypothetical protein ACOYKZ_07900 [Chlamydiia bacterium]